MNKLTIDFETRSLIDIKTAGMWRYAEDESTEVLCLALKWNNTKPVIWYPKKYKNIIQECYPEFKSISDARLAKAIKQADIIEAHNAQFERAIWKYKMQDFPPLELHKTRCSAAIASYHSFPKKLETVAKILKLSEQKDEEGYKLMMRMCKPLPKRKGEDPDIVRWQEDADSLIRLGEYCKQDTETEYNLSEVLAPLPDREQKIWEADQVINERGIQLDVESIEKIINWIEGVKMSLQSKFKDLTGLDSPNQRDKFLAWLQEEKVEIDNVQKATLEEIYLTGKISEKAKAAIKIRLQFSKASVAKYKRMLKMVCKDGRIRGLFVYYGAERTGRWAGSGVQPHNLKRADFDEISPVFDLLDDLDKLNEAYVNPIETASKCVRSVFTAAKDKQLICYDYKSIEAIVLAWLAGEEWKLKLFRQKEDVYKYTAAMIYGKRVEDITPDERRIGKVADLACGYQGYIGAFQSMAKNYGLEVEDEQAGDIVMRWRGKHPRVQELWHKLNTAAIRAVRNPGKVYTVNGKVKLGVQGDFLKIRLPSGRTLMYYKPKLGMKLHYGNKVPAVFYYGMQQIKSGRKWKLGNLYGGMMAENIGQAVSRDLLANGMLNAVAAGLSPVLHVHDECAVEQAQMNKKDVDRLYKSLTTLPKWAKEIPADLDGWSGSRYRKG